MQKPEPRFRELTDEEEARIQKAAKEDPDNPPLTDEKLARMRPAREVMPMEFFEAIDEMRKARGRPKIEAPKVAVTLRLDPDVLDKFKSSGKDWRGRMAEELRKAAGL
ncbi:BrnA antitoxin family protein [Aliirhizobium smilacinae]|uniref:BrnA antitoxin family protein n=1 Tax=Aliirhizobium smilacinae TaxID=1395944 RepID=A0A5C4XR63_9HYPH|nr:BrnA antitoxin family protein [Rhizobium smilacinae]TNM65892.1 BrnA antitoxin family protein [Rhizobium smilacinae]